VGIEADLEAMGAGCAARGERASSKQSIVQSIPYIPSETATFI